MTMDVDELRHLLNNWDDNTKVLTEGCCNHCLQEITELVFDIDEDAVIIKGE